MTFTQNKSEKEWKKDVLTQILKEWKKKTAAHKLACM